MGKTIDCMTLQGSAPIIKIRKHFEQESITDVTILVDNDPAIEDVTLFLITQEFEICVDTIGNLSKVIGHRSTISAQKFRSKQNRQSQNNTDSSRKTLIIISSERLGNGDEELGQSLMIDYIKALNEWGDDLWRLIFVNYGVKLTTEKSALHNELKSLESSGVEILVCGASLTHLGLMEKKEVGQTTDMNGIVTSLKLTDKVINL